MADRSPVITGLGVISALGSGIDEIWPAIVAGQSGLKPLTLFQSPRYGQVPVGEVHYDLAKLGAPARGSRSDKLAWLAAREAIAAAKINFKDCGERAGVLLGGSVGGSFGSEKFLTKLIKEYNRSGGPLGHAPPTTGR